MPQHHPRCGLSRIEAVVCLVLIVFLFLLLAPAGGPSRAAVGRAECKNNLKQIALALHNYHDVWRCFPPGMTENDVSWSIAILPYLEERTLYDSFNFNARSIVTSDMPKAPLTVRQAIAIQINTYHCPDDPDRHESIDGVMASNYAGAFGADAPTRRSIHDTNSGGFFGYATPVRIRDIKDGKSNTIMVGERRVEGTDPVFDNVTVWSSPRFCGNDRAVLSWGWGTHPIQSGKPGAFSSAHKGGAQFAMGDGRVIFLSDSVDFKSTGIDSTQGVFQNLLDRADGQKLGEF